MHHGAVLILSVIEEDEVALLRYFAVGIGQKHGYIQVKVLASIILVRIPAEANRNFGETRVRFG
ncbi:hypothetical protein D3C71_1705780 [compost metagenome]